MYSIEEATCADADYVALHMRQSDIDEMWSAHRHTPIESARSCLMNSDHSFVGKYNGVPFYFFGLQLGTEFDRTGHVWGLGTDQVLRHARTFYPASKRFVTFCRGHVDVLQNYVDCRNTASYGWLKRLGFHFDDPAPFGIEGRDFMRFWMPGGFLDV